MSFIMVPEHWKVGAMSGKKNKSDARQLTGPQRRFADLILSGECASLVAAYRQSYNVSGDTPKAKKSQANEASRLWKHPGIVSYADEYRAKALANRERRALGERERVRERLWSEADSADRSSDRLTALRLLGQDAGMFVERIEVKDDAMSDAEVLVEIELALREAIEAEAKVVNPKPNNNVSLIEAELVEPSDVRVSSTPNDEDDEPEGYLM